MSCAMRKASRETLSWKSPFNASRGAKAIACTRPSSESQCWPSSANSAVDLRVVGNVASEDEGGVEFPGEVGHALAHAFALVREGELGALALARPGDAVGDRAVGKHPGDEDAPALQEAHRIRGHAVYRIIAARLPVEWTS